MASQLFSTFTEVGLVDTRVNAGTITLPKTIDIPYRQISLKDIYGNFQNKTLTLNTQFPDTFEDATTTKVLSNAFGFTTLYAGGNNVWYTVGGTVLTSQTVSSLTVSTITGNGGNLFNLPAISSLSLQSTIAGLGSSGYVSTASLVSTTLGLQMSGFISSPNLLNHVSTAFLNTTLQSTTAGLGQIYVSTVAAAISQSNLTSTVVGLGTVGYISSFSTFSTLLGLSTSISTLTSQYLYGTQGFISSLTVNSLFLGSNSGFLDLGDVITASLSTIQINANVIYASSVQAFQISGATTTLNLVSTTAGLQYAYQTAGFVSAPNLIGHVSTTLLNTTLQSTVQNLQAGYQTAGFLSTATLQSTVTGLGSIGYVSTSQLTSTTTGIYTYISSFVDPTELTSTVVGLGTTGYVSTMGLLSTASGLASYITSFIDPVELASTVTGLGSASFVSTLQLTLNITSTVAGLGSIGYVSTASLTSTTRGLGQTYVSSLSSFSTLLGLSTSISTLTTQYLYGTQAFISSLIVNSLSLGSNSAFIDMGDIIATSLSTTQINTAVLYTGAIYTSSLQASTIVGAVTTGNLTSTVASITYGYQTAGFISTATIQSTTAGLLYSYQTAGFISAPNLLNHVSTSLLNNTIQSTTLGLQMSGFISTPTIQSTTLGLQMSGFISTPTIQSTTAGLLYSYQTAGFISTPTIQSTTAGLLYSYQTAGFVSSPNLLNLVSTTLLNTTLQSTMAGLGQVYISSGGAITQTNVTSTVRGLGTLGYVSSFSTFSTLLGLSTSISTLTSQYLYGTQGFISSLTVNSLFLGATSGFIDLGDMIATTISTGQINATIIYASSIQALQISGATTTGNLVSTTAGITIAYQTAGFVSAPNLIGHVSTTLLNTTLQSTVQNLQTGFQTAGFVSSPNLLNLVSTTLLNTTLQSTITGLGSAGYASTTQLTSTTSGIYTYISSFVDPTELTSTVVGLGTTGYVSTMGLLSTASGLASYITTFIDPVELASTVTGLGSASFVSTLQLTLNITSTVAGLGTVGYISSSQLTSTTRSYATYFTTLSASFSSVTASNVYASTLTVDNLQIGTGLGWVNIGPLQTVALSTNQVQAGSLYATSNFIGSVSTPFNAIQFYGLFGQYNNTVLAEVSTGVGTQELLFFKGSSTSDRIRLQTTGNIVFEPGSSARLWASSITSNATPAMIINTSSNVGIQTASPQATLDVAGTGRFQIASTLAMNVSTVNGFIPWQPSYLTSTVVGLGLTYVSTASLVSTTLGLQTSGFVSSPNLLNLVSTTLLNTTLQSTMIGLGSAGYVSSAISQLNITSTTVGLGSITYISSAQFTSTTRSYATYFTTLSASFSTIYASNGYISSLRIDSLQLGLGDGWADFGPLRAAGMSTVQLNAGAVYATSNFIGSVSTPYSAVQFYGLFGQYTNTVLAEVSTGVGTQELLLFKGSSTSDRIRLQTTGNIVFEPGSSARLWASSITSNVTPAMIINTSSNVGIQTASPQTTLDVAGTGRFQIASTLAMNVSTINGFIPWQPSYLTSTVQGLGTSGYVSTASLISTVSGSGSLFASTVAGLGTSGYVSTASLLSTVSASGSLFASTVAGLGTAGYISTASLISTVSGSGSLFASTVAGLGTAGYISSGLTSSNLTSSINNLLIPYSTLNTNTYFQVKASSTQLYYGMVGSTAQIYVGDVQAANGNTTATNPFLLMEQFPITQPAVTSNYSYTGADQTFTVPAGVTALNVVLNGAAGGAAYSGSIGGAGGYVSGTLAVTPGQSLTIMVGKGGAQATGSASSNSYGGGGAGGVFSGVGGGRSAIISGGVDRVTAGGGGGAGNVNNAGGAGGGTTGATGGGSGVGGAGGTQSAGGVSPANNATPWNGALGQGGYTSNPYGGYGGGGGGYYGGAVGGNQGGGGGGSSYVTNLTGTVVDTQGGGAAGVFYGGGGNGSISITYSIAPAYRPGNILEIRNYLLNKTIIDPLLNMGINVSSITPAFQFDVGGIARATGLSTQNIQLSSINGLTFGGPINSSIIGLGSSGYVSTASLLPTFASTVAGLGTAGYISTASLISTVSGSGSLFASTVAGLGTAGYISSAGVSQSNVTSSINSLLIPYSTLNTNTYFQVKASSTQLYYGAVGSTSQIYVGDILAANGNTTTTNPLLLMEQLPIAPPSVTTTFSSTGSDQSYTVPAGVTSVNVTLIGAGGGGGGIYLAGGTGGLVSGTLAVTPGETLTVIAGRGGQPGIGSPSAYGGGGAPGTDVFNYTNSGGGGGRSAIQRSGADIVTAGGGGGAARGPSGSGGAGGGTTGGSGGYFGASGGTQSAAGTNSFGGNSGSGYSGGAGGYISVSNSSSGGGGGGGWYGGGGGGGNNSYPSYWGGGGGGSSYVANLTGTVVNTQGGGAAGSLNTGSNGSVTISYTIPPSYRPGNILEIRNYQLNKIVIDPLLNMGINVVSTPSFRLDVNGVGRMGMPVSSITGTVATFGTASYGIYYYISNSGFSNITLTSVTAFTGWFVTLRNNTGSYLSVTVTGQTNSTPASPFSISPSNATTIAYDTNYNSGGTAGYAFF